MEGGTMGWGCVRRGGVLASLFVFLAVLPAVADTLTRGPYLQLMTATSAEVIWNTDGLAPCGVTVHPPSGAPTSVAYGLGPVCAISLTGLSPGTRYRYQLLAGGAPLGGEAAFRTDDPRAPYVFLAFGDSGCGCDDQRAVRDQMLASPA